MPPAAARFAGAPGGMAARRRARVEADIELAVRRATAQTFGRRQFVPGNARVVDAVSSQDRLLDRRLADDLGRTAPAAGGLVQHPAGVAEVYLGFLPGQPFHPHGHLRQAGVQGADEAVHRGIAAGVAVVALERRVDRYALDSPLNPALDERAVRVEKRDLRAEPVQPLRHAVYPSGAKGASDPVAAGKGRAAPNWCRRKQVVAPVIRALASLNNPVASNVAIAEGHDRAPPNAGIWRCP